MIRLRHAVAAIVLLGTVAAHAADPALPQLFKQAKDKFAAADYKGSLADFEQLDTLSARAGFEKDRAQLIPIITFYRGANLAALGRKVEAKEAFIAYLGYSPKATIASPPYPKATVALFDAARKEVAGHSTTMSGAYAAFTVPATWTLAPDARWADTPVRYLLTAQEKKEFAALTTDAERAKFVETFWASLDPTPGTPANELRTEFERRIAYADANFGSDRVAGRFSDRAVVLAIMGLPSYAAQSNITEGDDVMAGLRAGGNDKVSNMGRASGASLESATQQGVREAWHYLPNRIPAGVMYKELRFDFITKTGYGSGVMQKESQPLEALGKAALTIRSTKKLN